MRFDPVPDGRDGSFRTLFTCGAGWGVYAQSTRDGTVQPALTVLGGNLDGFSLSTGDREWLVVDGQLRPAERPAVGSR